MFPTINKKETGVNLRRIMDMRGVKPKDIQEYLGFGCVQSVYRCRHTFCSNMAKSALFLPEMAQFDYLANLPENVASLGLLNVSGQTMGSLRYAF